MSNDKDAANSVDALGGLQLDPSSELRFKGPFDDYVTVSLSIRNPTFKKIAFKIKTTAPKRYCVKPNSGVLDSQQTMKVNGKLYRQSAYFLMIFLFMINFILMVLVVVVVLFCSFAAAVQLRSKREE